VLFEFVISNNKLAVRAGLNELLSLVKPMLTGFHVPDKVTGVCFVFCAVCAVKLLAVHCVGVFFLKLEINDNSAIMRNFKDKYLSAPSSPDLDDFGTSFVFIVT
jgi:hypothetical protein